MVTYKVVTYKVVTYKVVPSKVVTYIKKLVVHQDSQ